MKGLLDIQQDIRKLEGRVEEITENIRTLSSDIEDMRNSTQDMDIDYSKTKILARQIPFKSHPLGELHDERLQRIYLELLLSIVRLDTEQETMVSRMIFLQWLQMQSQVDWPLAELYKESFKIDKNVYYEFADALSDKYKEYFIVDALIIANINGKANRAVMEYIADLSAVFGIGKEKLRRLSIISHMVLIQNIPEVSRKDLYELFWSIKTSWNYYLGRNIAEQARNSLRVVEVKKPDRNNMEYKWKVKQQEMVKEGDILAECIYGTFWSDRKSVKLKATVFGKIFQFRHNSTNYGVIAHESDNKDSIKDWVKAAER